MYIIQFVLKCLIGLWKGKLLAFGKAYVTMFVLVYCFSWTSVLILSKSTQPYIHFCINNQQKVSQLQHNGIKVTHYGDGDKISPRNIILEFPIWNASNVQSPMIHQICQLMTLNRFNYTITKYHYETVWKKYLPIKNFIVILFSSSVRKFCSLHVVVMSRWD